MSDVEQDILGARVTRLNFSELYQHLNAVSLLEQMVERQLILPSIKEDAEKYSDNYAKNVLVTIGFFSTNSPPTFLLDLCEILEVKDTCQQRSLAAKLRSGKSTFQSSSNLYADIILCILQTTTDFIGNIQHMDTLNTH